MIPSIEQEIRDLHALLGSTHDPEGRAFVPLADAYRRAGDPDRALELLERGLERHPDLAAGYLMKALAFRDLADDTGAESAFREVLRRDGDNARALVGLGRLLRGGGDDEEAERLIRRGVALDPRLASEGTPDRVPRHSTNPEVVSAEALAPLEWEVLEPTVEEAAMDAPPGVGSSEGAAAIEPAAEPVEEAEPSPESQLETTAGPVPESVPEAALEAAPDPAPESAQEAALESAPEASLESAQEAAPDPAPEPSPESAPEPAPESAPEPAIESEPEPPPGPESGPMETGVVELAAADASRIESLEPIVDLDGADDSASGGLDIEWEVEEFYGAVGELSGEETTPSPRPGEEQEEAVEKPEAEEVIVDAWTLAPDGWTPESAMDDLATPEVAEPGLEMPEEGLPGVAALELVDLAPDDGGEGAVPDAAADEDVASNDDGDDGDDVVLPTRTLGELYARQGLTAEALEVFRQLAEADPDNLEHRARLLELEAELNGEGRRAAATRSPAPIEEPDPNDPPISTFFSALLDWTSDDPADGLH